jgi:long-chain acyl-CoA synthetase
MTGDSPFDNSGTETGADGIRRYTGLPRNVVAMLQSTVEQYPERTAAVELAGRSMTYARLWDGARRVAGGRCQAG